MSPEIQVVEFTEIVGDLEIPCDYAGADQGCAPCPNDPARWALHLVNTGCSGCSGIRLACTSCKTWRLESDAGGILCPVCRTFIYPPRQAYSRCEALDRRP